MNNASFGYQSLEHRCRSEHEKMQQIVRRKMCCSAVIVLSGLLLLLTVGNGDAASVENDATVVKQQRSFERDCDAGYSVTCFKLDIVSFLEKMTDAREYSITSGISIVQDPTTNLSKNSEIVAGMYGAEVIIYSFK